ncbi:MAG: ribonuclease P protein component [Candidatus Cloacimonetes bacterium]|jgi:ribonuclease P protein component|nr:ribonuclease P protein component [Candidatus Cloacimonadota bacterium]MBT6993834.1 ribonuclease P protein component [Candidatus Cloacimonadota bacterium]
MNFVTSKEEYRKIYRNNLKIERDLFIFLKQSIPEDLFKIGIVVSKKVGNAVIRNKVKRRVKSFLHKNKELHPTKVCIIVVAKPKSGNSNWENINEELLTFFKNR